MTDTVNSQKPGPESAPSRTILDATESLLLEAGAAGLSIRRVSERCGYTAPTIYHHFGDKAGLIDALLEERFQELLVELRRVRRSGSAASYLRDLARAFIDFGLENPIHYQLLATPRQESADLLPSAEQGRSLVADALRELGEEGTLGTEDLEAAFQATWAVLHGLISIRISRPGYSWSPGLVEVALDMVERGLLRSGAGES